MPGQHRGNSDNGASLSHEAKSSPSTPGQASRQCHHGACLTLWTAVLDYCGLVEAARTKEPMPERRGSRGWRGPRALNFTGNSAWKPALTELGVKDFQTEKVIPRLLYERIGYWDFRTYEESETSLQYFYTMLLHAGLAASDWESIWSRLMLPLAKDMRKGKLPGGSYPTADELIKLANDKYSGYYLANRSAQNLISKAPEIIGGLLTSALSVATTLFDSSTGDGDQVMMSSELLPGLAMDVMGCGEVLGPRGEQASAWCEGFKATVDRSQVIGEGKGGSDLYPFISTTDGDSYNAALPSIEMRQPSVQCSEHSSSMRGASFQKHVSSSGLRVPEIRAGLSPSAGYPR